MTKVELTAPDGSKVWVFAAWIQVVRQPYPSEYWEGGCGAVLELSGRAIAVRETVDEVLNWLKFA